MMIHMVSARILAGVALAALGASCGRNPPTAPAANLQEFEERLAALQSDAGIPGISAAISKGQQIVWSRGLGLADLANNRPAADSTVFHLASLTKPFASAMLLQMVNEGKISLDDPVTQYGINLGSGSTIRVRHLLSH